MLTFCPIVERNSDKKAKYHRLFNLIVDWYKKAVEKYSVLLKTEAGLEQMKNELENATVFADLFFDLDYSFSAKLSYFCVSDTLIKLILSKYSIGPTTEFKAKYGIDLKLPFNNPDNEGTGDYSWMNCKANSMQMAELVSRVLAIEAKEFAVDFRAFASERSKRNDLTHVSTPAVCNSAIRCYRGIREMICILNPDCRNVLPEMDYIGDFSYDELTAPPAPLDFENCTTILIADSVHDLREDYRSAVANLPWDLVIDLDGYSNAGGLLSSVAPKSSVQREILCTNVAAALTQLPPRTTLWYRCGEYSSPSFIPVSSDVNSSSYFNILSYTHFLKEAPVFAKKSEPYENIFRMLLNRAKGRDRLINIVAVTDDSSFVKYLLRSINDRTVSLNDYFVSWIGLSEDDSFVHSILDDDDDVDSHFRRYSCPASFFYQAFAEHRTAWTTRQTVNSEYSLMGRNGPVPLREVERNNLANSFEPLYDNCEQVPMEIANRERDAFYKGNSASWATIDNNDALRLRKPADYQRIENIISSVLGSSPAQAQKKLFFIKHTAGIGGTTLARQIAWDLHKKYAVLVVRNFTDKDSFSRRVEHLYDAVLDKDPIVLYAEDTLPKFHELCDAVCALQRRCVLLAACRFENSILSDYPNANSVSITSLADEFARQLRNHFRSYSSLPEETLREKDADFDREISGKFLTPFFIGLYFMDRDFNVDAYVGKAIDNCRERNYADALAVVALCDMYNCKMVPVSLVNRILARRKQEDFLKLFPASASLVSRQNDESDVPCYHFKHTLLSERYFELYCEHYYHSAENKQTAMYQLITLMIDTIAGMGTDIHERHLDLLKTIMIQDRSTDSDAQFLSVFMNDIGMIESQIKLLKHLATAFRPLAEQSLNKLQQGDQYDIDRMDRSLLRVVSHAYAHLGRIYSRLERNYSKAEEAFRESIRFMQDKDSRIYHMAGSALLDKLGDTWNLDLGKDELQGIMPSIQSDVLQAAQYFDDTIIYGSPDYGFRSKLKLLYRYLRFRYKISGISTLDDTTRLDEETRRAQMEFMEALDLARSYPGLDESTIEEIEDVSERFDSQIMFGDYGKAVEYYQNLADKKKAINDISGYTHSLRSLVLSRIRLAQTKANGRQFYFEIKNPILLLKDIEELIDQPFDPDRPGDISRRSQLFHYWMLLAKHTGKSIEDGLRQANRWLEMEKMKYRQIDPEPYYYREILLYLSAIEGSGKALSMLHDLHSEITNLAAERRFDRNRGHLNKRRDILVKGKEMSQLFDVTNCRSEDEILGALDNASKVPQEIEGHLTIQSRPAQAFIEIYSPRAWAGESATMDIGRQSQSAFTENQTGHKVQAIVCFSVETLIALSRCVADLSNEETLDQQIERERAMRNSRADSRTEPPKSRRKVGALRRNVTFIPKQFEAKNSGWIIGTVDGDRARLSMSSLQDRFGKKQIDSFGGTEKLAERLLSCTELRCDILSQILDYGVPTFDVVLGRELHSLEELLGDSEEADMPSIDDAHPSVPDQPADSNSTPVVLPNLNRKRVSVIISGTDGKEITGTFEWEGKSYQVRFTAPNRNKALKSKTCVVEITGASGGVFRGRHR